MNERCVNVINRLKEGNILKLIVIYMFSLMNGKCWLEKRLDESMNAKLGSLNDNLQWSEIVQICMFS